MSASTITVIANQVESNAIFLPLINVNRGGWIGPYGGAIVTTAVDPSNSQIVYAGTWGSGMYKSYDGGQNWISINRGLDNQYINSFAIDPSRPTTLYAGTYKNQVFKSTDGGSTWSWSGTGMQAEAVVYSIAVDPLSPVTVYASTRGISNNGNPPWKGVLYISTDAGQDWTPILMDVGGADAQDWVYSIAIDPTANPSVYIATHEHGPFRSVDYGATWFPIHDGIDDDSGRSIVLYPPDSGATILYYGVWHFDSVYKTVSAGSEWYPVNKDIPYTKVYSMAIDPTNSDNLYMATFGRGIMKTEDGGNNWLYSSLLEDMIYNVSIDLTSPNKVFAGTAGDGIYKSYDAGHIWSQVNNGILNANATKSIISPLDHQTIIASIYDAGVYQSNNQGHSWAAMNIGLGDKSVHAVIQNPNDSSIIFALTDTAGLFMDDLDSGSGWVKIENGLPLATTSQPAYRIDHPFATRESLEYLDNNVDNNHGVQGQTALLCMEFADSAPQIAYMGTNGSGVYKSTNGGINWTPAGLAGETIQSLAIDHTDQNLVYAATTSSGSLKISSNGGTTWVDSWLPVTFYSLAASPVAHVSLVAGTSDGVYYYQAGTWTHLGLSGIVVTSILIDANHPGTIYAGTNSGAYISQDSGETWNVVDSSLKGQTIQSIDTDPANPRWIYFSSKTHGVYMDEIK